MKQILFTPESTEVFVPGVSHHFCGKRFPRTYRDYVNPVRREFEPDLSRCPGLQPRPASKGKLKLNPHLGKYAEATLFKQLTGFDGPKQVPGSNNGNHGDPVQKLRWIMNTQNAAVHPLQAVVFAALLDQIEFDPENTLFRKWCFVVFNANGNLMLFSCERKRNYWHFGSQTVDKQLLFSRQPRNVALLSSLSEADMSQLFVGDEDCEGPGEGYEKDNRLKELV